jgi:hypothetical protein
MGRLLLPDSPAPAAPEPAALLDAGGELSLGTTLVISTLSLTAIDCHSLGM